MHTDLQHHRFHPYLERPFTRQGCSTVMISISSTTLWCTSSSPCTQWPDFSSSSIPCRSPWMSHCYDLNSEYHFMMYQLFALHPHTRVFFLITIIPFSMFCHQSLYLSIAQPRVSTSVAKTLLVTIVLSIPKPG